ncbi:hypothetical protein C0991_005233 [Blastosporella zonata]|nr:hypothetical protein C0991_005233 [Blastosporella zonata]
MNRHRKKKHNYALMRSKAKAKPTIITDKLKDSAASPHHLTSPVSFTYPGDKNLHCMEARHSDATGSAKLNALLPTALPCVQPNQAMDVDYHGPDFIPSQSQAPFPSPSESLCYSSSPASEGSSILGMSLPEAMSSISSLDNLIISLC